MVERRQLDVELGIYEERWQNGQMRYRQITLPGTMGVLIAARDVFQGLDGLLRMGEDEWYQAKELAGTGQYQAAEDVLFKQFGNQVPRAIRNALNACIRPADPLTTELSQKNPTQQKTKNRAIPTSYEVPRSRDDYLKKPRGLHVPESSNTSDTQDSKPNYYLPPAIYQKYMHNMRAPTREDLQPYLDAFKKWKRYLDEK